MRSILQRFTTSVVCLSHRQLYFGPIPKMSISRSWTQRPWRRVLPVHPSILQPMASTVQQRPTTRQNVESLRPYLFPSAITWSSKRMMTACNRKDLNAPSSFRDAWHSIDAPPCMAAETPKATNSCTYLDPNEPRRSFKTSRTSQIPGAEQT